MGTDTDAERMRDLPLRGLPAPVRGWSSPAHEVPSGGRSGDRLPCPPGPVAQPGRVLDGAGRARGCVAEMDQCNIRGIVNLDGRWGSELADNLARYDHAYPGRFATCCHLDWRELSAPGFGERLAAGLRGQRGRGRGRA